MRTARGGRLLERLAGASGPSGAKERPAPARWRTQRAGHDPWADAAPLREAGDQPWTRTPRAEVAREVLQQGLLFPFTRFMASPTVTGAGDLLSCPQPAILAPNHASDADTPLILMSLPRAWRQATLVGAASDRFYASWSKAAMAGLWIGTFPFDRGAEGHGLGLAADHLRQGTNVLLYPQGTRDVSGLDGFRTGVARLSLITGAPLVPVHVGGSALVMPKGRGLTQRGRTTVAFGRPVLPREGDTPRALMERTRDAIEALGAAQRPRRRAR